MRTAFYLFVDDVEEIHQRAVVYGAKVEFEPTDMPYEDRQSGIIDQVEIIGGFQNDL